jgi:hypothetical protein
MENKKKTWLRESERGLDEDEDEEREQTIFLSLLKYGTL